MKRWLTLLPLALAALSFGHPSLNLPPGALAEELATRFAAFTPLTLEPAQPQGENCGYRLDYYSSAYFQRNFKSLVKRRKFFARDILISGINFNHPVDVYAGRHQIFAALNKGYSAQSQFNQQYVATQLSLALRPDAVARATFSTSLSCYGLGFEPVGLNILKGNAPIVLWPEMAAGEFFTACDLVANELTRLDERDQDMLTLVAILNLLNARSN